LECFNAASLACVGAQEEDDDEEDKEQEEEDEEQQEGEEEAEDDDDESEEEDMKFNADSVDPRLISAKQWGAGAVVLKAEAIPDSLPRSIEPSCELVEEGECCTAFSSLCVRLVSCTGKHMCNRGKHEYVSPGRWRGRVLLRASLYPPTRAVARRGQRAFSQAIPVNQRAVFCNSAN